MPKPTTAAIASLKARLGADAAMRLLARASEALDVLGIDRKESVRLAVRGAERLAAAPGLSTAALAEELREMWAKRRAEHEAEGAAAQSEEGRR